MILNKPGTTPLLNASATQSAVSDPLPEFWPPAAPPVVAQAWWIPWPLAVILVPLLWLMPRRMGPHFAAVRWPGVLLAHVFWTAYGIGCIALAYWAPHYGWVAWLTGRSPGQADPSLWPPPGAWDIFRAPLALEVIWLSETLQDIARYVLAWGVFVGCELAVAATGLLLMPFVAAGEPVRRLMARCVKMTFWATPSCVVLGLVLQAVALTEWLDEEKWMVAGQLSCVYVLWLLWIWGRSAQRYWGPAAGPAWESRRPRCEECGYVLTGLTAKDHCPECARPAADSLPARRGPTPFAAARGLRRVPAFFKTAVLVFLRRNYCDRLALRGGQELARRYAVWMCLLATGLTTAAAWCGVLSIDREGVLFRLLEWDSPAVLACVYATATLVIMLASLAMLSLCLAVIGDWRSIQIKSSVVLLHAGWCVPIGLVIACFQRCSSLRLPSRLDGWAAVLMCAGLVVVCLLIGYPLMSLSSAARRLRFANA